MRPKDAASLILVNRTDGVARVLMGRRAPRHAFMPDVFVFPGGAVDRSDGYVKSSSELRAEVLEALARDCTPHRARAIALAGIRETFEETGLLLGAATPAATRKTPDGWRDFLEAGVAPALDPLEYVAHAVTPPGPPRRFHARFFIADATCVSGELTGNGELLDLDWYPLGDAFGLPIAGVTRLVLKEVGLALDGSAVGDRIPLFTRRRGKRIIIYD
jgi:8-oxo-dGTP pyrophosphatase MutT (NUDIX family)